LIFVVTIVVSLWMGHLIHDARQQQLAVKVIRESGGTVFYDDELSGDAFVWYGELEQAGTRHWLARYVGQDLVSRVIHVSFRSPQYSGRVIRYRRNQEFPPPPLCNPSYPDPSPDEMIHVSEETIRCVGLLRHLKWLELAETDVDDQALEQISRLDQLQHVELGNNVTEAGFRWLQARLPETAVDY
jgi:hypothetical protein